MSEWTPEAMAAEGRRRKAMRDRGLCPDSGLLVHSCHRSICDCFEGDDCRRCHPSQTSASPSTAQRYTDPTALQRMKEGTCPECGGTSYEHSEDPRFWTRGPGCDLLPRGVTGRIEQYRADLRAASQTSTGVDALPHPSFSAPTAQSAADAEFLPEALNRPNSSKDAAGQEP